MSGAAPLQRTLQADTPAVAATADGTTIVSEAPYDGSVTGVSYTPVADITGAASPASRTFTIVNKGQDGNGTTVMATLAMVAGVNTADFDEKAAQLSVVTGATNMVAGDMLAFASTHVGATGLADPGGLVQIVVDRS